MHLCPDEALVVLSAAPLAQWFVVECLSCLRLFMAPFRPMPKSKPAVAEEGYSWFDWHPDYINEEGRVVYFDEPGGG